MTQLQLALFGVFLAGVVLGLMLAAWFIHRPRGRMVGLLMQGPEGGPPRFYRSSDVQIPPGDHIVYILPKL